jgi:predicted metal-dependent hydrolase
MSLLSRLTGLARKAASSTNYRLTPRKVRFDWTNTPLDWLPNHPYASHFINEINMILPAGEFWFCRLYNKALPLVTDEKLRDDVQMFIRQEAMHARAHGSAIQEYLNQRGINTERNTRIMEWLFEDLLADNPLGLKTPEFLQKDWLVFRLGIIAAVEHMTCVLGNYALRNKTWDTLKADPVLLDLIRWHGAEEVEHRCVAFDLYQHLGGSYLSRYYLACIATPMVFGLWVDGVSDILRQDPRFVDRSPAVWKPWVWLEWHRVSRSGTLPSPLWLAWQQLPFFSPWYNPLHEGSTEEALTYLANSPGAQAYRDTPLKAA